MCGRFSYTSEQEVLKKYRVKSPIEIYSNRNISPSQNALVLLRENGEDKLEYLKWGLVPSWAKDPKIGNKMFNARAETLNEKPSFKRLINSKRCLIPASGFYEWKKMNSKKQPFFIQPKDEEIMSLAGLYDEWEDPEGRTLKTFTIITKEATEQMQGVHERMPVIISEDDEDRWLNPNNNYDDIKDLLEGSKDTELEVNEI
jgi:putative SOS response-associated peptidase YedK